MNRHWMALAGGLVFGLLVTLGVASCSGERGAVPADGEGSVPEARGGASLVDASSRKTSRAAGSLRRQTMLEDPAGLRVGERFGFPGVVRLDDTPFSATELAKTHRAIVFAMTSTGCPLSTMYGPRVAAMEAEYAAKRVAFVHVNVVDAESREEMRRFVREHGLRGVYLPDRDRVIGALLAPRTTTEVFVFDPTFTLIYRGAIDDQFGVGTALDTPRRMFLRDALDSFLAGEAPKVAATWAPGCLVDARSGGERPVPALGEAGLTYMGRISKILDAHCVECHRPFGVAPFSLASYQDIPGRARMIEAVVRDGLMPPSHGVSSRGTARPGWVNPREMSEEEERDLIAWLQSDREVGSASEAPLPLERQRGWAMGSPDVLLTAGPMELPAAGPMHYVRSIVPTNLTMDRWATVIECRPMKQNAIHHAMVWLLPPGARVPGVDENPTNLELLFAYSPGQNVIRYDAGIARRIPAGSMLLVELYARPMGRVMAEALRIGMKTSEIAPAREVRSLVVSAGELRIGSDEERAVNRASVALDQETTVLALSGYMRRAGTGYTLTATYPNKSVETLIDAPRYDYRWQVRHEYVEPRVLARGTVLTLQGVHNNSESNRNVQRSSEPVRTGPRATEEALFLSLEVLTGPTKEGEGMRVEGNKVK